MKKIKKRRIYLGGRGRIPHLLLLNSSSTPFVFVFLPPRLRKILGYFKKRSVSYNFLSGIFPSGCSLKVDRNEKETTLLGRMAKETQK